VSGGVAAWGEAESAADLDVEEGICSGLGSVEGECWVEARAAASVFLRQWRKRRYVMHMELWDTLLGLGQA
jgi:hypothetical protein